MKTFVEIVEGIFRTHRYPLTHQLIAMVENEVGYRLRPDELFLLGEFWKGLRDEKLCEDVANITPYPPTDNLFIRKGWRIATLHLAGIMNTGGDGDLDPIIEDWDDPKTNLPS